MLSPTVTEIESGRKLLYAFNVNETRVSYGDVLRRWEANAGFRARFNQLLADAPFEAYRWETPPISNESLDRPFEFVLVNTPGFATRATDTTSFAEHFPNGSDEPDIVSFTNLRRDATLIVPTRQTKDHDVYNHLAAFIRRAPRAQSDALWRFTARRVVELVSKQTVWLNTAGAGVAWLHVRLDSTPKYYGHAPYRHPPVDGAI